MLCIVAMWGTAESGTRKRSLRVFKHVARSSSLSDSRSRSSNWNEESGLGARENEKWLKQNMDWARRTTGTNSRAYEDRGNCRKTA